jgi:TRAP-type mannitol/chloroaromatic compound transport system permease small subunit
MMKGFERFLGVIDLINGWTGKIVGHLLILMMLFITFEVIMRYVFNSPTLWVNEMNEYLSVILVALGGGYVLLNRGHVNVDVFYGRFGERTRAILDLLTSPVFFLFIIVLIWQTLDVAIGSWQFRERSATAGIPTYPVRIILVVGACLILLQGVAKFGRDFTKAVMKRSSAQPEKERIDKRGESKG